MSWQSRSGRPLCGSMTLTTGAASTSQEPFCQRRRSARLRPAASKTTRRRSRISIHQESCSKSASSPSTGLALDELHAGGDHRRVRAGAGGRGSTAFAERHHGERRLTGGQLAAEGQQPHRAAIEEEVDAAVLLAGLPGDLAGAGHPVEHLQGGTPGGGDRDRIAPEVGDVELGDLPSGRRHHRRAQRRLPRGPSVCAARGLPARPEQSNSQAARERPRTTRST